MPRVGETTADKTPASLRPFLAHGVDLGSAKSGGEATAECPFCRREGKFSANAEKGGAWKCWACDKEGGNWRKFLAMVHERRGTDPVAMENLSEDRGLLDSDTLREWQVGQHFVLGDFCVPAYDPNNVEELAQLYRYSTSGRKRVLLPTPEMSTYLFGVNLYDPAKPEVHLCEGPWDAMAWWEILGRLKREDDKLVPTANAESSLLASVNVLAVPGVSTFHESWLPLFREKRVTILFDSDYPSRECKKCHKKYASVDATACSKCGCEESVRDIPPAGLAGTKRTAEILSRGECESVSYLKWGEHGFDTSLPAGTDVRDLLREAGGEVSDRANAVESILGRIQPCPAEWLPGGTPGHKATSLGTLKCQSYGEVVEAFRKCMKWTPGLDHGLASMYACTVSTRAVGEQTWIRLISMPSCLHGDTSLHDPVDGTDYSIAFRHWLGRPFNVTTIDVMKSGAPRIQEVDPPQKFPVAAMYDVKFRAGERMRVTGGHRFWNGSCYIKLLDVIDAGLPYSVPSFRESPDGAEWIDAVVPAREAPYYDFHVPGTENYLLNGVIHHNTGKTTLCEALSTARKYVKPIDTLSGLTSGYQLDKEGSENMSLVGKLRDMTLIVNDGDTVMSLPNKDQIFAQLRAFYGRTLRTSYKNKMSADHEHINCTIILSGTKQLRLMNDSSLGERFLDIEIVEHIDDELEDEVTSRVVSRSVQNIGMETNGRAESSESPEKILAMRLAGGYLEYLRENAQKLLSRVEVPGDVHSFMETCGKFVAHLRARPSKRDEDEVEDREFAPRLAEQFARYGVCVAAALGKTQVDQECVKRMSRVALSTSKGRTLKIVQYLHRMGSGGATDGMVGSEVHYGGGRINKLLAFLRGIGVVVTREVKKEGASLLGSGNRTVYLLSPKMRRLYESVKRGLETGEVS